MSDFMKKFEELENKYGVRCAIHEELSCGVKTVTVYRLTEDESGKDEPLPEEFLRELSLLYRGNGSLLVGKILDGINKFENRGTLPFPFKISPTGKTVKEVKSLQISWKNHCDLFNACF